MNALRKRFAPRDGKSRRFFALVCLTLFLTLELFASVPSLHKLIHLDADSANHHCVITLLKHGGVSSTDTSPLTVAFIAAVIFCLPIIRSAVSSVFDYRLSPGRPPLPSDSLSEFRCFVTGFFQLNEFLAR